MSSVKWRPFFSASMCYYQQNETSVPHNLCHVLCIYDWDSIITPHSMHIYIIDWLLYHVFSISKVIYDIALYLWAIYCRLSTCMVPRGTVLYSMIKNIVTQLSVYIRVNEWIFSISFDEHICLEMIYNGIIQNEEIKNKSKSIHKLVIKTKWFAPLW